MNVRQLKLFLEQLFNSLDQNGKVVLFNSLLNVVLSESEMNSVERENFSLREKIDSLMKEYERLRKEYERRGSENTKLRSELQEAKVLLQMPIKVSECKE